MEIRYKIRLCGVVMEKCFTDKDKKDWFYRMIIVLPLKEMQKLKTLMADKFDWYNTLCVKFNGTDNDFSDYLQVPFGYTGKKYFTGPIMESLKHSIGFDLATIVLNELKLDKRKNRKYYNKYEQWVIEALEPTEMTCEKGVLRHEWQ